jgi:D-lyxose ketol-isomerase
MKEKKISGFLKQDWGYEIIWTNTENYCGKIMTFEKPGAKFPMHFHKSKDKSWFINYGRFILRYIDTKTGEMHQKILCEGETWNIIPLQPHQLEAVVANSMVLEVSTSNLKEDNYQLFPEKKKE